MKDIIQRAIENERIALRRYNKAIKDRVNISYYTGKIQGSNNCIRRLIEILSVHQHETPKVETNKQAKEYCACPIPGTSFNNPHRCIKCNKPIKWD